MYIYIEREREQVKHMFTHHRLTRVPASQKKRSFKSLARTVLEVWKALLACAYIANHHSYT